jgi:peptide/nickel transport system substrate-binding protein
MRGAPLALDERSASSTWRRVPMARRWRFLVLLVTVVALGAGCAGSTSQPAAPVSRPAPAAAPKKVVAGIRGTAQVLYAKLNIGNSGLGVADVARLVDAAFTARDDQDVLHAQLAEAVPTVENGNWKLAPDGTMETTWRLRPNARWHDGTPVTADDLVFTYTVSTDRELPVFSAPAFDSISGVEVLDPRTVLVRWRQPYIHADEMFSSELAVPLPKHLLEKAYQEEKLSLLTHSYFTIDFVGTGPFRVKEYVPDSFIKVVAYDDYVLGRPKIDELEARFIPDSNTILAYLLSEEIQLVIDPRSITSAQALTIKDQWTAGSFLYGRSSWVVMFPQNLNPTPAQMADLRFRRGLLSAINRQEMGDNAPIPVPVADSWIGPDWIQYRDVESSIVRYPFDLRRAEQALGEVGFTKGADGFYRDAAGSRLNVEVRVPGTDINIRSALTVLDYWNKAGIGGEQAVVPAPRTNDREYRSTYPGVELIRPAANLETFVGVRSDQVPVPENNWAGTNRQRYRSPELDTIIDQYNVAIPTAERTEKLKNAVHFVSDQFVFMGLIFDPPVLLIANRLKNVPPANLWNGHEWELN